MNITLASSFRNSVPTLQRYLSQCSDLDTLLYHAGHRLSFVWGEGDSTDGTLKMLTAAKWRFKAEIVDCTHGGGEWGSVVSAQRFRQLAHVGNTIWQALPDNADCVIYVESDLIWQPATVLGLIERLAAYPAISPMVLLGRAGWPTTAYYDVWATRKDGRHFGHYVPYHPCYRTDAPFMVDSTGSCMVLRAELARKLYFPEADVFVGLSRLIYENGENLWIDPTVPPVIHN